MFSPLALPARAGRIACLSIAAFWLALGAVTPAAAEKDVREVVTSGPTVPLSPGQRAALEAKRAVTLRQVRVDSPVVVKPSPVTTIGEGVPGAKPKPAARPGASLQTTPAGAAPKQSASPQQAASIDPRALDEVRAGLGVEKARAAGLVKSGASTGATTKAPKKESRP